MIFMGYGEGEIDLSIVIPVFNEEENILLLYEELKSVMDSIHRKYEIIFVDDGSLDNTTNFLRDIYKNDKKVRVILFQKNYGKSAALSAGFKFAKGDIIITLDGDMQDDPTEIPRFLDKIDEGNDLVVGWKYPRRDPLGKKISSKGFNTLTRVMTGVRVHDSNCGFKAYRKEVANRISFNGGLYRYIPSLALGMGYKVGEIKVRHRPRKFGKSKYGTSRLIKGFNDLIAVSFIVKEMKKPNGMRGQINQSSIMLGFFACLFLILLWISGISSGIISALIILCIFTFIGFVWVSTKRLNKIGVSKYKENKGKIYKVKEVLEN